MGKRKETYKKESVYIVHRDGYIFLVTKCKNNAEKKKRKCTRERELMGAVDTRVYVTEKLMSVW